MSYKTRWFWPRFMQQLWKVVREGPNWKACVRLRPLRLSRLAWMFIWGRWRSSCWITTTMLDLCSRSPEHQAQGSQRWLKSFVVMRKSKVCFFLLANVNLLMVWSHHAFVLLLLWKFCLWIFLFLLICNH